MLELIPGLGKKTMKMIIDERKKGKYKSLKDIEERVSVLYHTEKLILARIEQEIIRPGERYHIFVAH